jgi:hypothetical protein
MSQQIQTGKCDATEEHYKMFERFGLKHKTLYSPGMKGIADGMNYTDERPEMHKQVALYNIKSLNTGTGGAGTAGNALIPVYVDSNLIDLSRKFTPIVELIPRVTNMGITADYNVITKKDNLALTLSEGSAIPDEDAEYKRESKKIKYLYAVGSVTGQAQAAIPQYSLQGFNSTGAGNTLTSPFSDMSAPNAMQLATLVSARALKEFEENLIINGNETTSVGLGADGTEFDGIIQQMGTINQNDLLGAELQFEHIDEIIELAFNNGGRPSLAIASAGVITRLRSLTLNVARIDPTQSAVQIMFGIAPAFVLKTMVGEIPVIPSQFMNNVSGQRSIYFLDMMYVEMRVLLDMVYQEKGVVIDGRQFFLKIYETLILKAKTFNSQIVNIK